MKRKRYLSLALALIMVLSIVFMGAGAQAAPVNKAPLVPQELDFTENPIDIPNPERGFYRPTNYVVPVSGTSLPSVSTAAATITGTSVRVQPTICYMVFNLLNFSSNSPTNQRPIGPWSTPAQIATGTNYGTTQPLTETAINYIRTGLQRARDGGLMVLLKFTYDENGRTYVTGSGGAVPGHGNWDRYIHDTEPGAPYGREWYESSEWVRLPDNTRATYPGGIYDNQPWELRGGTVNEDQSCGIEGHEEKNWIQYHMWQLSGLFEEYEDTIMTIKGGIFGPWGEMHSSSYTWTPDAYHWLTNMFLDYLPDSRGILTHAGGAMAWQNMEYGTDYNFQNLPPAPERGSRAQRIGMFNDSFMRGLSSGVYNDNGSLSEGYNIIGSKSIDDYNRQAAMDWMRNQNFFYGGETVGMSGTWETNPHPRFPSVPYESAYMYASHLNFSYSSGTYQHWGNFLYNEENVVIPINYEHNGTTVIPTFDPVYDGMNGMEFMRDRLGYRLVQREGYASEWVVQDGVLEYEGKIQNVGFGYIVNKKQVTVILRAQDGTTYSVLTDIDPWYWEPDMNNRPDNVAAWRDMSFAIDIADFGNLPAGKYDILLKVNDPSETSANLRCIRFANNGNIWNASLGANYIGSTEVVEVVSVAKSSAKFISVNPINGKSNDSVRVIEFSVNVTLNNGTAAVFNYSFEVKSNNNNPDGKYTFPAGHDLEGLTLTFDIKGNGSNIKTFRLS